MLLKNINKDTPLTTNNINESNSADLINKTNGTVFFLLNINNKYEACL